MKLFVGLGNPGAKYAAHRHNVGFMAVERIAAAHGFSPWRKRFQGETADGTLDGIKVLLLKPATYMNDSGRAVGEAVRYLKIDLADVVVFYDEIDLAPGKLKVKSGGGNAGHNGLRSISHLVGNDFQRVRIGVGHPGHKDLVANYVLHDFAKADRAWLDPLLDAICDASPRLAGDDGARFLTDVALRIDPPSARSVDGAASSNRKPGRSKPTGAGDGDRDAREGDSGARDGDKAQQTEATTAKKQRATLHPAGDRQKKRQSALADNLQKWLKGRSAKK